MLGAKVRDSITGRTGTVISVCHNLFGHDQVCVLPDSDEPTWPEGVWMEMQRVGRIPDNAAGTDDKEVWDHESN